MNSSIKFIGEFDIKPDPSISHKQWVETAVKEVWAVTGWRFRQAFLFYCKYVLSMLDRVNRHPRVVNGYKTRLFCCQDADTKAPTHLSKHPNAKRRDNLGMMRYHCNGILNVSARRLVSGEDRIRLNLHHDTSHLPYFDITMPSEVLEIIRRDLAHLTPNMIVSKVRKLYPNVSRQQIYNAWSTMSKMLWKRDPDPMTSASKLLREYSSEIDLFDDIPREEGVEQLCFGLRKVLEGLKGKIIEIALDATCKCFSL